jgi:hypothetical protein
LGIAFFDGVNAEAALKLNKRATSDFKGAMVKEMMLLLLLLLLSSNQSTAATEGSTCGACCSRIYLFKKPPIRESH